MTRKEMKKQARQTVKRHYALFLAICLVSAFLGSEFSDSIKFIKTYSTQFTHAAVSGPVATSKGVVDVAEDIAAGDTESGRKLSKKIEKEHIDASKKQNPAFGRSRGVFAQILNGVTSGSLLVTLASGMNSLFGSQNVTLAILLVLCLAAVFILLDSHCKYLRCHLPQDVSGRAYLPQSSGPACVIPATGKKMAPCVQDDAYRFYFSVSVVFYGHRGHHKKVFLLPRALHHGRKSVNQIPGCNPTVQRDDERT